MLFLNLHGNTKLHVLNSLNRLRVMSVKLAGKCTEGQFKVLCKEY